jgi:Tol biopolymer transport system component
LATWVAGPQALSSIWEISVLGGTPRKLTDQGMWPAASPDGSQVAFVTGSLEPTEIRLMQADGTNVRKLVEDDGKSFFGPPVWAPDGKKIAYARGKYAAGNARIEGHLEALDLASGRQSPLLSMPGLGGTIAWTPDGRLIYSLNEPIPNQNDANLWAVRIDQAGYPQGPGTRLTHGPGFAGLMSLTTDGKRLAYFRRAMEPDVYIADLESNGTKLSEPRRLTFDERSDFPYSWTPDNKAVLFVSNRNGAFNVFKQNVNETEPEVLERGPEDVTISRLSADGSSVLYLVPPLAGDSSHDVRLMRMPLAGGPPQTVLVAAGGNNYQCARLPYTVCVVSTIDSGRERFFYFDLEKGLGSEIAKAQVQSTNSFDYNWSLSPDGKTLALAKKSGMQKESGIRLLPLEGGMGRIIRVTGDWLGIGSVDWAADGKSLWAIAYTSTGPRSLLNVDLGGRVRTMLEEKKMNLGWAIPSPDGKHLALWKATGSSNVWMLENF